MQCFISQVERKIRRFPRFLNGKLNHCLGSKVSVESRNYKQEKRRGKKPTHSVVIKFSDCF